MWRRWRTNHWRIVTERPKGRKIRRFTVFFWENFMSGDETAVIAAETIFGQSADGERFPIEIEIRAPFKWGAACPTEWACQIKVTPWRAKAFVHGDGSLQPLTLALRSIESDLATFVQDGGKLMLESGEDFPLSTVLPKGWS